MAGQDIILTQSEYEALLEEIHRLQARISELAALRDDLLYHVCPALQAEYEEKIGSLEREILAAEVYLRENQRLLEILQAQMNQRRAISYEEAEKKAKEEFHEYEEDLKRKTKEAEDFKKNWEKESQWSTHERKEKEERKKKEEQKDHEEQEDREEKEEKDKKEKPDGDGSGQNGEHDNDEKKDSGDRLGKDSTKEDRFYGGGNDPGDDDDPEKHQNESVTQKIKHIYREIVKRLHPDVHPNPTPREKELFVKAREAQKRGDLEALERIYEEISGMDAPEDKYEDTPEGIARLKEAIQKLRARLSAIQIEIMHIRSEYPYTMKSFLEDDAAVEAKRMELQEKLRNLREANEKLAEFIRTIRKQMGM